MMNVVGMFKPEVKHVSNTIDFAVAAIWKDLFQDRFSDKAFAIDTYNKWNEEVIRYVPKERLLVFEVKDGWKTICEFLEKPVPPIPYPHVNDTAEFKNRKKQMSKQGVK
jgi:hypothetical protein